jgi:hypothetical protein
VVVPEEAFGQVQHTEDADIRLEDEKIDWSSAEQDVRPRNS